MTDRVTRASKLGRMLEAGWRSEDVEAQLASLRGRQHRDQMRSRVAAAVVVTAMATVALVAGITAWLHRDDELVVSSAPGSARAPTEMDELPTQPEPATSPTDERTHEPAPSLDDPKPPTRHPIPRHAHPARPPRASQDAVDAPAQPEPVPSWRDDADRGDYAAAWLELARITMPLSTMEDLLAAADVARWSGHVSAAVEPLVRTLALHADDPRAQLAAFTLGRVHLESLGAPREAAAAFARARDLAPEGPLAEDALAREVEAWSRAGETDLARLRATLYLRKYPGGHRARAIRRFGGLEAH